MDFNLNFFSTLCDRILFCSDGWSWLYSSIKNNSTAITHSTENTTRMVGAFRDMNASSLTIGDKGIIILTSCHLRGRKASTKFYALDGSDAHNCLGKFGVQFIKYRLTKTDRNTRNNTADNATCGILSGHQLFHISLHEEGRLLIRHEEWILFTIFRTKLFGRNWSDGLCKGQDFNMHFF